MSTSPTEFGSAVELLHEYQDIEKQLSDPAVHADTGRARTLGRRFAQLGPVVAGYQEWKRANEDLVAARELAREDESFKDEIPALENDVAEKSEKLQQLLLPRDPDDDGHRGAVLAGTPWQSPQTPGSGRRQTRGRSGSRPGD